MSSARRDSVYLRHRGLSNDSTARRRRMRLARLEPLEHRVLLASLQFAAGLGEQSTLDSLAQTADYLPDVNNPATQQFTDNDGIATSNVTLTTAASTTGNPGVNLDILSKASVAKNGIASVAVNAGLADTSGEIGVAIPVTIVASNSSEQVGDPVDVQFSFAFDVKTFRSNDATANFSYGASYTYDGVTTPLASKTDQLGGSGITPVGSEPVDEETGTLHADIGDTFTLTFSENLAGQTIAPYLGDGINNVGWVVNANLDVSIVPAIILRSVRTTDSTEALVDYDISGSDSGQPLYIQIYRSDRPTFQSNDRSNVAVSVPYQIKDTQPGQDETADINLSNPAAKESAPVLPLAPDPSLPYVLAVVVDAQGNAPADVTVDETQAHFKIWVIADVTYGFQLPGSTPPIWPTSMAFGLIGAGYNSALAFTWNASSWKPGQTVSGGDQLYLQILQQADLLSSKLGENDVIDVQLIGHSRGSAVIAQAMQDLADVLSPEEPLALQEGYYKLTFLDPHPANLQTVGDASIDLPLPILSSLNPETSAALDLAALLLYTYASYQFSDPPADVSYRVNQVEDFYEQSSSLHILSTCPSCIVANPIELVFNLMGDPSQITIDDPEDTVSNQYDLTPLGLGHSDVWQWYLNNVIPTLGQGSPPPFATSSDGSTPPQNMASLQQLLSPQFVASQSEAGALAQDLTTAMNDLDQGSYTQAVSNLRSFDSAVQSAPASDFTASSEELLISTGQSMIADLNATDVINFNTATAHGPGETASPQADDPANNQQISGAMITGPSFTGTASFSVGNYSQDPETDPSGRVSQATFDVQAVGINPTDQATASATFTAQVPTPQLGQAVLSYLGDDGQWHTIADYNGSTWVQVGPSGTTPIQEQDSPVSGTNMSSISLPVEFNNNTSPAIDDMGGTVFVLTVPAPISLNSLPGGTVGIAYDQTIVASGGTGDKSLAISNVDGSIAGLTLPTTGANSLSIDGTPTAAGTVSFTVQATDSTGLQFSKSFTLTVTTADPSRSTVSITPSTIAGRAIATVTLTAIDTSGAPETTGGLNVQFGLGAGDGGGTFSSVTDNGDGKYTAVLTGTVAGNNTITATINGQPVTTQAPTVAVTPGEVNLTQSTMTSNTVALPVGGSTTVTLTARDAIGNQESTGGLSVAFAVTTAVGTFGAVTDNGDGTYNATFTASSPGSATFTATINAQQVTSLPTGVVVVPTSLALSTLSLTPSTIGADGTALVTLTARDTDNSQETTGGWTVVFALGSGAGDGTFGPVTDHGDGTYSATFTAGTKGANAISGTIDGFAITASALVTVNALPTTLSPVSANGRYESTATLTSTLTSSAEPVSGKSISFSLNEGGTITPVGEATTNASGIATLTGVNLLGFDVGTFTGVIGASFAGDSADSASQSTGDLTVNPPASSGLTLAPIPNQSVLLLPGISEVGPQSTTLTITASATDTPGAIVRYSIAPGGPIGPTIGPASGVFSWTVTSSQGVPGIYPITIDAIDNSVPTQRAQTSFTIDIQQQTKVISVSGTGAVGGTGVLSATLQSTTSSGSTVPIAGQTISFSVKQGSTVTPLGTRTTNAEGLANLSGVSLAGFSAGTFTGDIEANFGGNTSQAPSSASGNLTVNQSSGGPPLLTPIPDQTVVQGHSASVTASTYDSSPGAVLLYSLAAGAPTGAMIGAKTGDFSWTVPTTQTPGVYPVTIDVTDNSIPPQTGTVTFMIAVQQATNLTSVSGSGTLVGELTVRATLLTLKGSAVSGKTVAFTLSEGGDVTPVGTATTNAEGVALLVAAIPAGVTAGSYAGAVGASFAADPTDASSSSSGNLTINQPSGITYTVRSLGDTGTGTGDSGDLRYAITQADVNPGSVIDFGVTGTIQLTKALPDLSSDVTINGPSDGSMTIEGLSQSASDGSPFSVFTIDAGATVSIAGLSITGNYARFLGTLDNVGTLTLTDCTISGNTGSDGPGGVYNAGTLTMIGSSISDNSCNSSGAGIVNKGTLTLTDTIVSGNSVPGGDGGGIDNTGALNLIDSTILGNVTGANGGGIFNAGGAVSVVGSAISGNSARKGGGFYNEGEPSQVTMSNSSFSANSASYEGGAISNWDSLTLTGCTLSSNTAVDGGGAILNESGGGNGAAEIAKINLTDSTLSDNKVTHPLPPGESQTISDIGGGAILNLAGVMALTDSTVSGNSAPGLSGGGIENYGPADMTLIGSTISGNVTGASGGGIASAGFVFHYGARYAYLTMTGSTIYGNSASYGGGVNDFLSHLAATNCTITGNKASPLTTTPGQASGGLNVGVEALMDYLNQRFSTPGAILNNTIIAGNSTSGNSGSPGDVSGLVDPNSNFNLIGDGDSLSGITNGHQGNLIGSAEAGNVIDAKLGPLAGSGGPTETVALLPGSPAIGAGTDGTNIGASGSQTSDSTPAPTSSVNLLPAIETTASFTVRWSGQDPGGPGIASYTIYVSDNGGTSVVWQNATSATSAIFNGVNGHTYGFYSVATDHAGNVQPTPTAAQTTTTVQVQKSSACHQ